jgi:hypothetical protein
VLDAQLKAEVISIDRGAAIRLNAVECPHVADVLEQRLALLWSGWRPGIRHAGIVARRGMSNRGGVARRATPQGTLPRSAALAAYRPTGLRARSFQALC